MITKSIELIHQKKKKKSSKLLRHSKVCVCVCVREREREREHLSLASKSIGDNTKIDHISSNHELMKSAL